MEQETVRLKLLYLSLTVSAVLMVLFVRSQYEAHFPVALPGSCVTFVHPLYGTVSAEIVSMDIAKGSNVVLIRSPKNSAGLTTLVHSLTIREHGYIIMECE